MITSEIYWDDLTNEAKERLKHLWHENIDDIPIAIIDNEEEYSEEEENLMLYEEHKNKLNILKMNEENHE